MWYNKYLSGFLLLSALTCGVIFADYGIVDGVQNTSEPSSVSNSSSLLDFSAGLSFALVRRHLIVAYNDTDLSWSIAGPVDYIKMLEDGVRFDVIRELKFVEDKWLYLTGYLSNITHVLSLVDGYTVTLQENIDRSTDERATCIQDKKDADERFFASLSDFNQAATDLALQESMVAWSCEESARISIVATTLQLRRIKQLHEILAAKQSLLDTNTSMIIQYFPLVEKELLQKLLVLSSQLQNYTTSLDQ